MIVATTPAAVATAVKIVATMGQGRAKGNQGTAAEHHDGHHLSDRLDRFLVRLDPVSNAQHDGHRLVEHLPLHHGNGLANRSDDILDGAFDQFELDGQLFRGLGLFLPHDEPQVTGLRHHFFNPVASLFQEWKDLLGPTAEYLERHGRPQCRILQLREPARRTAGTAPGHPAP